MIAMRVPLEYSAINSSRASPVCQNPQLNQEKASGGGKREVKQATVCPSSFPAEAPGCDITSQMGCLIEWFKNHTYLLQSHVRSRAALTIRIDDEQSWLEVEAVAHHRVPE